MANGPPAGAAPAAPPGFRAELAAEAERAYVVAGPAALLLAAIANGTRASALPIWLAAGSYPVALVLLQSARRSPRMRAAVLSGAVLCASGCLLASPGAAALGAVGLLLASVLATALAGVGAGFACAGLSLLALLVAANAETAGAARTTAAASALAWLALTGWLVARTARIARALAAADTGSANAREPASRNVDRVAHEFNNALFVILGWNDLLRQGQVSEAQRREGHAAVASAGETALLLSRALTAGVVPPELAGTARAGEAPGPRAGSTAAPPAEVPGAPTTSGVPPAS